MTSAPATVRIARYVSCRAAVRRSDDRLPRGRRASSSARDRIGQPKGRCRAAAAGSVNSGPTGWHASGSVELGLCLVVTPTTPTSGIHLLAGSTQHACRTARGLQRTADRGHHVAKPYSSIVLADCKAASAERPNAGLRLALPTCCLWVLTAMNAPVVQRRTTPPCHVHPMFRRLVPPVSGVANPFAGAGPKGPHRRSFSNH